MESVLEKYFIKKCNLNGLEITFKLYPYTSGIPDRIILIPGGKVVFVELKNGKAGRLSKSQQFMHDRLRRNGFEVYVIRNREEVKAFIASQLKGLSENGPAMDT